MQRLSDDYRQSAVREEEEEDCLEIGDHLERLALPGERWCLISSTLNCTLKPRPPPHSHRSLVELVKSPTSDERNRVVAEMTRVVIVPLCTGAVGISHGVGCKTPTWCRSVKPGSGLIALLGGYESKNSAASTTYGFDTCTAESS